MDSPVHEAPTTVESRKSQMYAALPLHAQRLFSYFKPMTPIGHSEAILPLHQGKPATILVYKLSFLNNSIL